MLRIHFTVPEHAEGLLQEMLDNLAPMPYTYSMMRKFKDTVIASVVAIPVSLLLFIVWTLGTGDFWRIF